MSTIKAEYFWNYIFFISLLKFGLVHFCMAYSRSSLLEPMASFSSYRIFGQCWLFMWNIILTSEKEMHWMPTLCFKSKSVPMNNTAILYLLSNSNSSEVLSGGWSEVAVTVYEEPAELHPWWWDGYGQDLPFVMGWVYLAYNACF